MSPQTKSKHTPGPWTAEETEFTEEVLASFDTWTDDEGHIYLRINGRTIFGAGLNTADGRIIKKFDRLRRQAIGGAS